MFPSTLLEPAKTQMKEIVTFNAELKLKQDIV
jgi:hypothetical protein